MLTPVTARQHAEAVRQLPSNYTNHSLETENSLQLITKVNDRVVALAAVAFGARFYAIDKEFFK